MVSGFKEKIVSIRDRATMAMMPSQIPAALNDAKNSTEQALCIAVQQSDLLKEIIQELKAINEKLSNHKI